MWKYCPHCKQHKDLQSFGTDRQRKDKKHPHCRLCRRGYRLLRCPVPIYQVAVATDFPSRASVDGEKWEIFDDLVAAGVPVTILLPNGQEKDWSELV